MIRGSEFTPTYYVGTNQKKEVTELTKKNTNYYKYIWDNVATYTDEWGKHSFTGMLGASMRQEQYRLLEGTATNVPEGEDVWKYIALGNKEGATVKDDGWKYRGLSYFTRLNYNYNDKYMLMFHLPCRRLVQVQRQMGLLPLHRCRMGHLPRTVYEEPEYLRLHEAACQLG